MKQKLFILAIVGMICMSATQITQTVVRPATPISTVVIHGDGDQVSKDIIKWANKGYVLKNMTSVGQSSMYEAIAVMEKY